MTRTSDHSVALAPVLDYAPTPDADSVVRQLRMVMILIVCMIGGASLGWIVDPREFQATGYVHVATDPSVSVAQPLPLSPVEKHQAAVAAGMKSSANFDAVTAALPPKVVVTKNDLAQRLNVRAMPQSRLVAVTFRDDDPLKAAAVVNAVMRSSRAPGVQIVAAATPPAQPQRNRFLPTVGLAVGLLAGMLIVARRSK